MIDLKYFFVYSRNRWKIVRILNYHNFVRESRITIYLDSFQSVKPLLSTINTRLFFSKIPLHRFGEDKQTCFLIENFANSKIVFVKIWKMFFTTKNRQRSFFKFLQDSSLQDSLEICRAIFSSHKIITIFVIVRNCTFLVQN